MYKRSRCLIFIILFMLLADVSKGEVLSESVGRPDIRAEKLLILVDKVMQPEEGWITKEWMVKEAADAGFNVFTPRYGHDRFEEVELVVKWCQKYRISYMPWMRGTVEVPINIESNGKRYVSADGKEQPLYSPNSDEFWEWLNRYIVAYAKISIKNKNFIGVFIDFEDYAEGFSGDCYELSYDDSILNKFAKEKNLKIPVLELGKRKLWLETQGLHNDFENFQVNYWRQRCRILRRNIDQINPDFKFCIYPEPTTLFLEKACYLEWATKSAPVIVADHSTYSKPKARNQTQSLQKNREMLVKQKRTANKLGVPHIFISGIDPIADPRSDPEFCGRNAVMISENSDGYWVFYEGPQYKKDHSDYFKWFRWANKAIFMGRFEAWHE